MQSKAKTYGQILKEVLQQVPENKRREVRERFRSLLKKRGDLKLLSKALQEFKKLWENREGMLATVIFASAPTEKAREMAEKILTRKGFVYRQEVDSTLIGGTRIFLGNDILIDNTIRGKLQALWQKTTSLTF